MLLPLLITERDGDNRFPWSPGTPQALARVQAVRTGPIRVVRELLRAFGLKTTLLAAVMALFVFIAEGLTVPVNADLFTTKLGWTAVRSSNVAALPAGRDVSVQA